jgi:predicted ArsR family transcriptional regulator
VIPSIAQQIVSAARTARNIKEEAEAPRYAKRADHLHTLTRRTAWSNKAKISEWLKKQAEPVSVDTGANALGISRETTRKHMEALAEEGLATVTRTRGGWNRYLWADTSTARNGETHTPARRARN